MALNLNQTATGRIAPTSGGQPAPVTKVQWSCSGGYSWIQADDGLSCVFTATSTGTGFIASVTANASDGSNLSAEAALPDVIELVADSLNLTISVP